MKATTIVGFGEIDRSVRENNQVAIPVDIFGANTDNITLRVFPVTVEEFAQNYASSRNISLGVQTRINAITHPAKCKSTQYCTDIIIANTKYSDINYLRAYVLNNYFP